MLSQIIFAPPLISEFFVSAGDILMKSSQLKIEFGVSRNGQSKNFGLSLDPLPGADADDVKEFFAGF